MSAKLDIDLDGLKKLPTDGRAWDQLFKYLREVYLPAMFEDKLNAADREDIANDTIRRVFSRIQNIRCKKYLKTTARRFALRMILRRKDEVITDQLEAPPEDHDGLNEERKAFATICDDLFHGSVHEADILDRIKEAFVVLPRKQREFLEKYLNFLQAHPEPGGGTQRAFAKEIGWTEENVHTTMHRIRARLKNARVNPP